MCVSSIAAVVLLFLWCVSFLFTVPKTIFFPKSFCYRKILIFDENIFCFVYPLFLLLPMRGFSQGTQVNRTNCPKPGCGVCNQSTGVDTPEHMYSHTRIHPSRCSPPVHPRARPRSRVRPIVRPLVHPHVHPSCALTIARLPHRAHPRSHPSSPPSCAPTIACSPPRAHPHSLSRSPPRTKIELHLEEPDSGILL